MLSPFCQRPCLVYPMHALAQSQRFYQDDSSTPHRMVIMSELWQRLRQARRYADQTQAQLAQCCGVSRGAVALWEAAEPEHRTKPTTDHLIAVAKCTGVPLTWLLNDASDLDEIWRLSEFGASPAGPAAAPDPLPDLRQGGHLFVFAALPDQVATKLAQLASEPDPSKAHLILIGAAATIHSVPTPADALARVVHILTSPT